MQLWKRAPILSLLLMLLGVTVSINVQAQDTSATNNSAWTRHEGNTVSLSAPDAWFNLRDSLQLSNALNILSATNPSFNSYLESLDSLELFLFDPDAEASINITAVPISTMPPLDELLPLLEPSYAQLNFTVTDMQTLALPVGDAGRFTLAPTTNDANGNPFTSAQYQYILPAVDRLYFVTFSAPPDQFDALAPLFETIADTIEIAGNAGGWQRYSGADVSLRVPGGWRSRAPGENTQIAVGMPDDSVLLDVTVTALDQPPSIADILAQLESAYTTQGREVITLERVNLPAGMFVRGETLNNDGVRQVQFVGVVAGKYLTATFTVNDAIAESTLPIIERMMHTLRRIG